jgi:hypothetical protein
MFIETIAQNLGEKTYTSPTQESYGWQNENEVVIPEVKSGTRCREGEKKETNNQYCMIPSLRSAKKSDQASGGD